MSDETTANGFPSQKKSSKQKSDTWAKQCINYAETQSGLYNEGVRLSKKEKFINYRLYNGHIDMDDLELTVNPHQTIGSFIPDKIPHYPIAAPKIDLLVGEELNRRFEYKVIVSNPDAISEKERSKAELWRTKLTDLLMEGKDQEEGIALIQKYDKYLKFEWQDIKEMTATNILRHYYEKNKMKYLFNECFKDATLAAEEIVQCEIISNEPIMHKLNPLNVHTVRSGASPWIQDADLIIVEDYWSPGRIIDTFYDKLKPSDIKKIEENFVGGTAGEHIGNIHSEPNLFVSNDEVDDFISMAEGSNHVFGNFYDTNGNVRILRVYWRSYRKVIKVKYYDEDGDAQYDFFPEDYVIDEDKGEEGTSMWVNEMWEGTKVADSIYLQMRPMPVQFNDINNPSRCHAGIVGLVHNTNEFKGVSLMDRMKQYQYLYDTQKDRVNKALAKYLGPLLEVDLAKIPDNWQMDKWLHFAYASGLAVTDSFKEGRKGVATGKLAGNFNTSGGVINLDMGNYIQNNIEFLEYIKSDMAQIVGISPQREGAISNRETVGGVERAVNQSSHITEQLYAKHEMFKAKALETFLEVAKVSLKNGNKKLQYILGDESIQMLEVDDSFADGCYDILISFNDKYQQLENVMKELAQAGIQNDKMDFSTLMSIWMSNSLSETRRSIELKEEEKVERESQAADAQNKIAQEQTQAKLQEAQAKEEGEEKRNIRDNKTKLLIAQIQAEMKNNEDMFDDDGLLNDEELLKHKDEMDLKWKQLAQDDAHHKEEMTIKEKEVAVKKIAANKKPATSSR
jgi:hypothetical protein